MLNLLAKISIITTLALAPGYTGQRTTMLVINNTTYCPMTAPLEYNAGAGQILVTVGPCTEYKSRNRR